LNNINPSIQFKGDKLRSGESKILGDKNGIVQTNDNFHPLCGNGFSKDCHEQYDMSLMFVLGMKPKLYSIATGQNVKQWCLANEREK
jgi:hypothetical protein